MYSSGHLGVALFLRQLQGKGGAEYAQSLGLSIRIRLLFCCLVGVAHP